jgi:putative toxin-antitoxin system antitoxin component (TIGR02293 family)
MTEAARAAALLGGPRILKRRVRVDRDLGSVVRDGLPAEAIRQLAERTHTSVRFLVDAAGLNRRTLERRLAAKARLKKDESDSIVRLARIVAHATDTLGDDNGLTWLQERQLVLGGKRPIDLLDTEADARCIEDALSRIDHGVFS